MSEKTLNANVYELRLEYIADLEELSRWYLDLRMAKLKGLTLDGKPMPESPESLTEQDSVFIGASPDFFSNEKTIQRIKGRQMGTNDGQSTPEKSEEYGCLIGLENAYQRLLAIYNKEAKAGFTFE